MLLGPHIRPVDDGCPLAARCRPPKCGERGRGMFDTDAADNRVMDRRDRRWLDAENRRPQGEGGNGRDGRRGAHDRSVSRGHGRGARAYACSCTCDCTYPCTCSCACFLRIRGRCRTGSTVSGHIVVPAASRRLGVRQPDRGFLFLADQTGTGRRGSKANIGGQHQEGRCGECAKQELHDGLLLLVTKGAVSSPCPGLQARQTRSSRVIQCVLPVFGRLLRWRRLVFAEEQHLQRRRDHE